MDHFQTATIGQWSLAAAISVANISLVVLSNHNIALYCSPLLVKYYYMCSKKFVCSRTLKILRNISRNLTSPQSERSNLEHSRLKLESSVTLFFWGRHRGRYFFLESLGNPSFNSNHVFRAHQDPRS